MKLTGEQVEYIADYIESRDIKWYELQVELTDHMVSSMEEFWAKNPELPFDQVKKNTFKKFSKQELKAIEKERTKSLSKELAKKHRKMIADYLTFPKIIGSVVLVYVAFTFSAYFVSPQKYIAVLFCVSLIMHLPLIYYWWKNKEIEGKKFLTLERLNYNLLGISFSSVGMSSSTNLKEELFHYQWLVLIYCCIWVLVIIFFITAIHLNKMTVQNVKRQFQLI